jgi:hypothetical protein
MAKLKSGTRIYGTATIDTSVVVGSAVTLSSSGLQVTGNSLITGISTVANLRITPVGTGATVGGIGVTYYGDGSQLTGVSGGFSISTNTTNQAQFITYAISTGSTTGLGVSTTKLVFNPSSGNLGVGTTNPQYIFTVTDTGTPATTGLTNCLADFTTTANSYGQINLRNTSTGTNASSDIVITADTGNDSTNFIDLGINNSGFSVGSWTINGPTDGYLYTSDTNLSIGAASATKYVSIFAGGTLAANEKLRANNTGVGIGTTNPTQSLHVQGNARITGGIYDSNNNVGTAGSILSSTGSGLSWITSPATTRTVTRSSATEGQTSFSVTYTVGYIDVFLNGSKLDSTEYTASNGTSVVLVDGASVNDVLEFISYSGISISTPQIAIIDDNTLNSTLNITLTDATSGSISSLRTASSELTFNPGTNTFSTGTIIATQTRIQNVAEKLTRVDGNTVSIAYTGGGGNIGFATNPTGDITLNVTGIPTDSSFDNYSITFSVIVNQTGTARSCTAVNLNGVSRTIRWSGGSLANAISGVTTTSGYDIYNFTGINTVGSASTTANYQVLGVVNGGFR